MALTAQRFEQAAALGTGVQITKFTIPYTELTGVADTTAIVPLFTLPANGVIFWARSKHSVAFAGPSISDASFVVGKTGTTNWVLTDLDIDAAVADGTLVHLNGPTANMGAAAVGIIATVGSTGANLSVLTAGSVDVWICWFNPTTNV